MKNNRVTISIDTDVKPMLEKIGRYYKVSTADVIRQIILKEAKDLGIKRADEVSGNGSKRVLQRAEPTD